MNRECCRWPENWRLKRRPLRARIILGLAGTALIVSLLVAVVLPAYRVYHGWVAAIHLVNQCNRLSRSQKEPGSGGYSMVSTLGETDISWSGAEHYFHRLSSISFSDVRLTERELDAVRCQSILQSLTFRNCSFEYPIGELIESLKQLRVVGLSESAIDDSVITALIARRRSLLAVDLSGTGLRRNGLRQLARLDRLRILILRDSEVDSGLCEELLGIPTLQELHVSAKFLSDEEASQIQARTPAVKLVRHEDSVVIPIIVWYPPTSFTEPTVKLWNSETERIEQAARASSPGPMVTIGE